MKRCWPLANTAHVKCIFVTITTKCGDNVMLDKWIVHLAVNELSCWMHSKARISKHISRKNNLCTYDYSRKKSVNYSYGEKMLQSLLHYYRDHKILGVESVPVVGPVRVAYWQIVVAAAVRIVKKTKTKTKESEAHKLTIITTPARAAPDFFFSIL